MSSEQKWEELCVLTVLPAPISARDAHVPRHVSPLTSEQGGACGRAHECIPFEKIFNPDGFKFPSYKNRQGWAVMKCLGTGIWYFATGNIIFFF